MTWKKKEEIDAEDFYWEEKERWDIWEDTRKWKVLEQLEKKV